MGKQKKLIFLILFLSIVMIVGLWGVNLSPSYIMVSEITHNSQSYVGKSINTMGSVQNGTLQIKPGHISFSLLDVEDTFSSINVEYAGDIPANFKEGQKLSLSGTMVSSKEIRADKIVVGCPSKYSQ